MPKGQDPFRKYVQYVEKRKWRCTFCDIVFAGSTPRIRAHLAGKRGKGIKACKEVEDAVRAEALKTFKGEGSGLDNSTGGTTGEGTRGTDTQNSNQLGCTPQQGSLPPDDRPPDNLDTSQPSSLLYLSETPAQPDLSTHLEFEGDVLPTPLLNKITPTCISPGIDEEDPGLAEQFANEVLLDSLPGTAPARPQDQESLSPGDRPRDNLDNTQESDPSNCRSDAANGIENASSPQRRPMDSSASPYHYFTELEPLFQLPVAFAHMDIAPFVPSLSQASNNALPFPQHLPRGTGLMGLSSLPELDMNEGAPMTSHPNTGNNFEENRALKTKLELLYCKEAIIRDELDFAASLALKEPSAASLALKEPRMEVVNLLASVEKLKNDYLEAMSEDCLPSHQLVDILMNEAEDLMRPDRGLFEVRETKVGKLLEEKMVGEAFRRNTTKILEFLVGNQISRLGIYGMGGVGKATIMMHIHNRLLEEANYGNVLRITMSQDFNTQRLQDDPWKELGMGILQENDVRKRAVMLCDILKKRGKSTIILDDVWACFDLKEAGIPVRVDGIKLVFIARSFEVCRRMHCQEIINIEPLSHIEVESLFFEKLGLEVAFNWETEAIVKSIVGECAGLPLVVITIARSMQGVTNVFEWRHCWGKLRESFMRLTDMRKRITSIVEIVCELKRIPSEDYWTDTSEEVSLMQNEIGELPNPSSLPSPSSLPELDVNEGAPMTSHPNTGNNFEENIALKRKLEQLYSKEASIREGLGFTASLSLKKPRKEVANWLANAEKLRNDCPEANNEDWLPPHQQVDVLMDEAKDLMRQAKGVFDARETKVNKLLEEKMAGEAFRRNTIKILEYLIGNKISRLGIYGMGGVGKTTIMAHIHNRLLEEANYGNVLWITMSQDFKTVSLQDVIGKELGLGILQEKDPRKRAAILCDCLTKRGKPTIILDDVWEHFDLKEVGIPVRADAIKLVLTTRSLEVCRRMQCQEMIKIEPLSHTEAKSLFLEELGFEVALNLETRAIAKSIVQECAGLPLGVITIARNMRGVTNVFEWKDCLEKLRESDLGLMDIRKVLRKLEFSYNHLGNDEAQQCFLSCAFYPKGELIDKYELIEFFIDQGLISQLNTREKQYDRGLTILHKLENVCLLEDHGRTMKMHNLIRDMALQIMRPTSIVKARKGLRRIPYEDYWTDTLEKVSLMQNEIGEFPLNMLPNCPKLSTFLLNANYLNDVVIPDSFFKQLWGLKVLNLSRCNLRELPNSISDLVNLRALVLRYCQGLCRIPYLGKLKYLRKLDIYECASLEVIRDLEMLVNLTYLDLSGTRIERLPKGTLGALLSLQYLKVKAVNGEDVTKLWELETLECSFEDVDDFNKFVKMLSKQRNKPHHYKLNVREEASDIYVQVSDDARFRNYDRSVYIKTWNYAIVSVEGESGGNCILIPQDVRSLTASKCDGITKLSDVGPLENLEKLNIVGWKNLWVLCGGQDEEIIDICDSPAPTPTPLIFPSLRVLKISNCPKLKYLFKHGFKFCLPHLQKIDISYCEQMVGLTVADTSPPLHLPLAFPSLEDITVWSCPKMKRVVEYEGLPHLPNLRRLKVSFCENMEEIIRGPSPYMPSKEVSLEGSVMTAVDNTPSSSQPSISLQKLKSLWLSNLPRLNSICEVPVTRGSMEFLEVSNCPKLDRIPSQL